MVRSSTAADTAENAVHWGKPRHPCTAAIAASPKSGGLPARGHMHVTLDAVFGPSRGKGTERSRWPVNSLFAHARQGLLFLLDRGFWAVDFSTRSSCVRPHFLSAFRRVQSSADPRLRRPDDSFLAWITNPKTKATGRSASCATRSQIRNCRIATSLSNEAITAVELVRHYYLRLGVELSFSSMKVHQCARKTGQCPTLLRSKLPNLVEQESTHPDDLTI